MTLITKGTKVKHKIKPYYGIVTNIIDEIWCTILWKDGSMSNYEHINNLTAAEGIPGPFNQSGILYISCGIPGSGKSTFLKSHIAPTERIVSRDEIRFSLLKEGEEYFSHEDEVWDIFIHTIADSINNGINTYADATHLNYFSRMKLLIALEDLCKPSDIKGISFNVPLNICIERNEKRKSTKAYVPINTIRKMARSFSPIAPDEFSTSWEVDKDGNISKIEYQGGTSYDLDYK